MSKGHHQSWIAHYIFDLAENYIETNTSTRSPKARRRKKKTLRTALTRNMFTVSAFLNYDKQALKPPRHWRTLRAQDVNRQSRNIRKEKQRKRKTVADGT